MKTGRSATKGKPAYADVPHLRPSAAAVKRLEEKDKELRATKDIKKRDASFLGEAKGLLRFLKRFKRL